MEGAGARPRRRRPPTGRDRAAPPRDAGPDRAAAIAARDRLDALVKPAGSLGALEALIERWASITGAPPPAAIRAGVLVCAADHGHVVHGTSLFDADVSAQVDRRRRARRDGGRRARAARRPRAARRRRRALRRRRRRACATRRSPPGSADMLAGPALTATQLDAALAAGAGLVAELAERGVDCLVLGEIGIGNTATTAALVCALTGAVAGASPSAAARASTPPASSASARSSPRRSSATARRCRPREALRAVGGLELAALAGAVARGRARGGCP